MTQVIILQRLPARKGFWIFVRCVLSRFVRTLERMCLAAERMELSSRLAGAGGLEAAVEEIIRKPGSATLDVDDPFPVFDLFALGDGGMGRRPIRTGHIVGWNAGPLGIEYEVRRSTKGCS